MFHRTLVGVCRLPLDWPCCTLRCVLASAILLLLSCKTLGKVPQPLGFSSSVTGEKTRSSKPCLQCLGQDLAQWHYLYTGGNSYEVSASNAILIVKATFGSARPIKSPVNDGTA